MQFLDQFLALLRKWMLTLKRRISGLEYKIFLGDVLLATVRTKEKTVRIDVSQGLFRDAHGLWVKTPIRVEPSYEPGGTNIVARFPAELQWN
jgi:hypothetical protein